MADTAKLAKQEYRDGSPAFIEQEHIKIKFQLGPVKEFGDNGCQIDDIVHILIDRLEGFQRGQFACEENTHAIAGLKQAIYWLKCRTYDREHRGVEGKNIE